MTSHLQVLRLSMAPAEGRFAARLPALPYEELLELAAKGAHHSAEARRFADAKLAKHDPLPA